MDFFFATGPFRADDRMERPIGENIPAQPTNFFDPADGIVDIRDGRSLFHRGRPGCESLDGTCSGVVPANGVERWGIDFCRQRSGAPFVVAASRATGTRHPVECGGHRYRHRCHDAGFEWLRERLGSTRLGIDWCGANWLR